MPLPRVMGRLDIVHVPCGRRVSIEGLDAHIAKYCPANHSQGPPTADEVRREFAAADVAHGIANRR